MISFLCQDARHIAYLARLDERNNSRAAKMYIQEPFGGSHKHKFTCTKGHVTHINPYSVIYGTGCSYCSGKKKKTTESYKDELADIRKTVALTLKDGEVYKNSDTKLLHICENGHEVAVQPYRALSNSYTCKYCTKKVRYSELNMIRPVLDSLGLTYVSGEITNQKSTIELKCNKNHEFTRTVHSVVNDKYGCPKCIRAGWSRKCIDWLESVAHNNKIFIQHATNLGEHAIPGTRLKVDGFCSDTNTIYEFHGDRFHGNLRRFLPGDKPHPFSQLTALELFESTIRREERLKSLGYHLVTMWELDYDSEKATT